MELIVCNVWQRGRKEVTEEYSHGLQSVVCEVGESQQTFGVWQSSFPGNLCSDVMVQSRERLLGAPAESTTPSLAEPSTDAVDSFRGRH